MMSNQNKKHQIFFGQRIWKIHGFFVKSSSNAPTGVDRKTQNKKSNSGSILYSYIPQNLEYDAEI